MRVDVLVHPYYSELVRLPDTTPTLDTGQKTERWYQCMDELKDGDYLIVVSSASSPLQKSLTNHLLEHGRKIHAKLIHYEDSIPESVAEDLPPTITRIRGYGEIYRACVDYWTCFLADKLCLREIELSRELSVGLEIK